MQSVIAHHREDTGVTLLSAVLLQGTTTHSSPSCLSYVSKAEDMTTCASMDTVLATMPVSIALETVSVSMLKILVNISLCNDRTVMHIYKVFSWFFLRQL